MKRLLALLLTISLCITTLSACKSNKPSPAASTDGVEVFQVGGYPIWVTTPTGWGECDPEGLDLQCASPKGDMYLSAYGFSKIDLSEEQSVQDLFEMQNVTVLLSRDNVAEIEPVSSVEYAERTVFSALYAAERDGVKNYYHFFFIHFKGTDDMAWILVNGIPSVVEKNKDSIDDIISRVQNNEPGKGQEL